MPRTWLTVLFGRTGIRIGRSIADSEWCGRLPSWRRYELRKGPQAAAEARGEEMNREDLDYTIDKALAIGGLDSAGNLAFPVKGTREEIVAQILSTAKAWGIPMTHEQAESRADEAIAAVEAKGGNLRAAQIIIAGIICGIIFALAVVIGIKLDHRRAVVGIVGSPSAKATEDLGSRV